MASVIAKLKLPNNLRAAMAIFACLATVLVFNEYKYRATHSPLVEEIHSYKKTSPGKLQVDVTPVLLRHLNVGDDYTQVTQFFDAMGFDIVKSNRIEASPVEYDEQYFGKKWYRTRFSSWSFMSYTIIVDAKFRDKKLVHFNAKVKLNHL